MQVRGEKLYITQSAMNRIYHGTHTVWDVLRSQGAQLLALHEEVVPQAVMLDEDGEEVMTTQAPLQKRKVQVRVPAGQHPRGPVVGIDLMDEKKRFLSTWAHKFITTIPASGEKFRVKEVRVQGLPPILVETPEMKSARVSSLGGLDVG